MPYPRFSAEETGICLSTLAANPREVDAAEVETIVRACHAAGFRNLALGRGFADAMGVEAFKALLSELQIRARVIEAIVAWTESPRAARNETEASAAFAAAIGADTLMAATIAPQLHAGRAVEGFAASCEVAADHGLRVALEFIPGTAVPDLKTAWHIARESGAENGGVVIDFMHWYHQPGGPDFEQLQAIPPERIHYVQICDSPDVPTPPADEYIYFAMTDRRLPGEGIVDIDSLLSTLDKMGANPFFALETFNTELLAAGVENMADSLYRSVEKMLG